jgi:hypothetical protein
MEILFPVESLLPRLPRELASKLLGDIRPRIKRFRMSSVGNLIGREGSLELSGELNERRLKISHAPPY